MAIYQGDQGTLGGGTFKPKPPRDVECFSDTDCPTGYKCKAGKCVKIETPAEKTIACIGGICKETDYSTPELIARCRGKNVGDKCGITETGCKNSAECPIGYECKNGKCVKITVPPPEGGGGGGCKGGYKNTSNLPCPKGYKTTGIGGEQWCCPEELTAASEFKWSPEIEALMNRILAKANELLNQPRGLSDEERQAIYNRSFEQIKGMERPAIQSRLDAISRIGMLGSPYAEREVEEVQRQTPQLLATTSRDIAIDEAKRRFSEQQQVYQTVMQMLGQGMGGEQIVEALNAARRGEGTSALQMILQYFMSLYGGQNNAYWQAIINALAAQ